MGKQVQLQTKKTILQNDTVSLTTEENFNLLKIIKAIYNTNQIVPPSMAKFLAKNEKKLLAQHEKNSLSELQIRNEFMEYINYVERHTNGHDLFWDGVEDNIVYLNVEGDEHKEIDTEKSTFGVRAWFDKEKNRLIDVKTEQPLQGEILSKMSPYVADEKKREVYKEKLVEFDKKMDELKDKKSTVHVVRISSDYLEETRIAIPTTQYNQNIQGKQQLDLGAFYEFMTINEDEEEAPEIEQPKEIDNDGKN